MSSGNKLNNFLSPVKDRLRRNQAKSEDQLLPIPEPSTKDEPDPWENINNMYRVIPQGSPLEVVMSVVQHMQLYEANQKEFRQLRVELEEIFVRLRKFGRASKDTDSIQSICRSIREELDLFSEKQNRGNMQKHTEDGKSVKPEELMEYSRRTGSLLRRLSLNICRVQHDPIKRTYSNVGARFSQGHLFAEQAALRHGSQATGPLIDTLTQILSWVDSSIPGSMYWVTGAAGTGKTVAAFGLCEELKTRSILAASIFLAPTEIQRREPKYIIPYLVYQLTRFSAPYQNWDSYPSRMYYEIDFDFDYLRSQIRTLILEPMQQIQDSLPKNTVVVIDGLNKYDDEELALELLLVIRAKLPIKFVIFSRPGIEIQRHSEEMDPQLASRVVQHDLDDTIAPVPVEAYLRSTLAWISPSPSQFSDLVQQANHSLAYATVITRYLQAGEWGLSSLEKLSALPSAPPILSSQHMGIDELYNDILQEIFQRSDLDAEQITIIQHILCMIACYRERLTLTVMVDLLNIDRNRVMSALKLLRPVVHVFEHDGLVVPLDVTFSGYLLGSRRPIGYYHDPNNFLAHCCFNHIRDLRPQFNIGNLRSSYKLDDENHESSDSNWKDTISPLAVYSCQFWADHMQASINTADLDIRLEEFLSNHFLLWLEILNLSKNTEKGPILIDIALQWAKRHAALPRIISLTEAALHFATSLATNPVSQSTPHMYLSLLPALPLFDPIRRLYRRRIQGGVQITGSAVDRLLMRLAKRSIGGQVYCAAFAPDGGRVALGAGNDIQVVDAFSGQPTLEPFKGHAWSVMSVTFSPDGARVASGSRDKTIRVWNSLTGESVLDPLIGHTGHIRSVAFSPSGSYIISGSNDETVRIWDAATGELKFGPLSGHTGQVKSLAVFSDNSRIVSGSHDGTICIWELSTGDLLLGPLKAHTGGVISVCLSPDNRRIVTGSADRTILIWDSQSGQTLIDPIIGHTDWVLSVAFTPDGAYILSGSSDCTIRIWDAMTGELMAEPLREHESHVYSVLCSPTGAHFASTSGDETFCLWKAHFAGGEPSGPPVGHMHAVQSICVSSDGTRVVSGSSDQSICVWDLSRKSMALGPLVGHSDAVTSVCFSEGGKNIVSGSDDGTVRIWDNQTGASVTVFGSPDEYAFRVNAVACANTRPLIVSGASDGTVVVWSVDTRERVLGPFKRHYDSVQSVQFSLDDSRIVTGSLDRSIYVLNVQAETTLLGPLWGHTGGVRSVGFSPDGTRVVSGSDDKNIRIWNALTGQISICLKGHDGPVLSVQFSPNNAQLASGSEDHTICVWNARSGAMQYRLTGHTDSVNSIAFFPGGNQLVSASSDRAIRVWDIRPQALVSGSHHSEWRMDEDGWIDGGKDSEGQIRRLAWLNPKLRTSLITPRCTALFSREGYVRLEIEGNRMGESWVGIYR